MSPEVLAASGSGMRSFTDTTLIEDFGTAIELTRKTFLSEKGICFSNKAHTVILCARPHACLCEYYVEHCVCDVNRAAIHYLGIRGHGLGCCLL